jgi:hypothetical protein
MPSSKWFNSLSPQRRKAYLKQHKKSKFHGKPVSGAKPVIGARPSLGGAIQPSTAVKPGQKAAVKPPGSHLQGVKPGAPNPEAEKPIKLVPKAPSDHDGKAAPARDVKKPDPARVKGFTNKVGDAIRRALKS